MGKRALLINPNRFKHPPVIPLSLEYLGHSLKQEGIDFKILDLCFAELPHDEVSSAINNYKPDTVCVTIRNVDSVLYPGTEFFLPEIKNLVAHIKSITKAPVIIGGAALSAGAEYIKNFTGTDIAVQGPAEGVLPSIIKGSTLKSLSGVIKDSSLPSDFRPKRSEYKWNARYMEGGGVMGFQTHKGCSSTCSYCIEACSTVYYRDAKDVAFELKNLNEVGHSDFHLCDSEFNEDPTQATAILREIIKEKVKLNWALYMRVGHYSPEMFEYLAKSGAYLITLSADTLDNPPEYWNDVKEMISLAKGNGIRTTIDLLSGFPYESQEYLYETLEKLETFRPDNIVINTNIRLYAKNPLAKKILSDDSLNKYIINQAQETLLNPVFYNHVNHASLKAYIEQMSDKDKFRIAGEDVGVNYQINKQSTT